jgi:hypothetical protein
LVIWKYCKDHLRASCDLFWISYLSMNQNVIFD